MIWKGKRVPQVGESMEPGGSWYAWGTVMQRKGKSRLERTDLGGAGGLPDLTLRARKPDQDFKQDAIWLHAENGSEGVKREHQSRGHRAGAPGLRSCKGTMRLLQESRGPQGFLR